MKLSTLYLQGEKKIKYPVQYAYAQEDL